MKQVVQTIEMLLTALNILDKQGLTGTKMQAGKQSYEYYDGEHHYYGHAFYIGRKLVVISERE